MEVICISDKWQPEIPLEGAIIERFDFPIKDEILEVSGTWYPPGYGLHYSFEKYDSVSNIRWFDARFFADITSLTDEINESLKRNNPNIKKFALEELYQIGYRPKFIPDDVPLIEIYPTWPSERSWYTKILERC